MKELKVKFQRTLAVLLSVMVAICSTPTVAYAYEYAEGDQITLKFDAGTEAGYTNVPSGYVYSDNVYTTEDPVEYGPDVITPSVTLLPEPDDIPNGKVFVGWRSTGDGDFDPGTVDLSSLGNSITGEEHHYECVFTAVYADVYGISYDENGGNAPTSENPESWNSNENEFTLNAPTREGYDFQGWFLAENTEFIGEPITNAVTVLNSTLFDAIDGSSISLVAKWEAKTYTITLTGLSNVSANSLATLKTIGFSMNDNDAPTSATTTKTIEDSLTIPEIEKPGARFIKWDDGNDETVDDKTVTLAAGDIKSELEYQAVFADEHTLTLTGLTGIDASSVTTLEGLGFTINGDTATKVFTALDPEIELPRLSKTGTKFGGWYTDNPASADTQIIVDTTVTEDVIYHAKFTVRYSIIFMDGDTELIDLRSSYASGQAVIDLDALPPKTSYTSNGWILEGDESKTLHSPGELALADLGIGSTLQEGNLVFNASYTPTPYTITLTGLVGVSENSIEALEELGFTLNEQKTEATIAKTVENSLTIPAIQKEGYRFIGWQKGTDEPTQEIEFAVGSITEAATYEAIFEKEYTLTLTGLTGVSANSIAALEAAGFTVEEDEATLVFIDDDEEISIPNLSKEGYDFQGWYAGNDPTAAAKDMHFSPSAAANVTYKARFIRSYSVTFMDGENVLTNLGFTYLTGATSITLPALPEKSGYTAGAGWFLQGEGGTPTLRTAGELTLSDIGIENDEDARALVFIADSYTVNDYTITLTGLDSVSSNSITALEELGFTLNEQKTRATITKTVEDSLTIPAVTPKAHKVFNGWIAAEVLNAEASKTIVLNTGDITDNMSYKATFATAKNILVNFQLAEGAFMAADIEGWSAFGYEAGVNDSISAYVDDDRTAISNIPAPRKDGHIFAGWTVDGSSEKVMSYNLPVPNNQTISLTANWITGTAGETTIVVAGSGSNTISANSVAAIKEALDSTLDNNQTAITKLVIEEDLNDAHAGSSLDTEISKEFTGATTLTKTYVEIDITQYITSASENSVEREINDLGRVVDITYTPTNGVENLRAIVREHGDPKTYTRFRELAAAPTELEDGTYFVDDPVVHIYTRYFSAYAFAYAANVFTVSFDSNGGDQTYDSIQTNKLGTLPTPTRTGYWEFVKWTYSDGSTATTGDDITEDTVLTAVWQDTSAGKITGVSLNKTSLRLYQGQTYTLIATVNPEDVPNKNITWTSSDANIAIVGAGTVEAKNVGTCTITATSAVNATKFATCEVTVLKSEIIDTDESGKAINPGDKAIDENGQAKVWVAGLDTVGYFYTGNAIKPLVHVYKGYELLKPGVDYTLSYKNNKKVSTNVTSNEKKPQIIIKMKGRHSGSETVYFTILPMPIDRLSASDSTLSAVYKSGRKNQLKPTVVYEGTKVKYGKKDLSLKWFTADANGNATNTETTCIEPGLYAVKVFAGSSGNFVALTDDGYQIATIDVSSKVQFKNIKLNGFKSNLPYSGGSAVKQPATLNYQSKALVEGTDYTVTYENNYNIGKATVTYEAVKDAYGNYTGKYAGKITKPYKITGKYALKDATIVLDKDSYDFANAAIKPAVTATIMAIDNEGNPELRVLTQGKDYTVSYKHNKAVAAANAVKAPQVIIKGKGNFTGSVVKNFAITKADLSSLVLTIPDKPYSKKADAYKAVKIQFLNQSYKDLKLKANKDYTATYTTSDGSNTPAAGQTVSVTLTAKETSSYTGSVTGSYRIVNTPDIKKAKVVINPNAKGKTTACVYTGAEIEPGQAGQPKVVVTMSKKQLTQGTDFEILSYYNNVTPGKSAIMVIRGIGSYSGVRAVKFTISNKPVSSCWGGVFGQN